MRNDTHPPAATPYVFISYAHTDEAYVRTLAAQLQAAGYQPWYFTASQTSGVNWAQRLADVVSQALAVIVVISAASNNPAAEYVLAEVMLAQREKRLIVPLKIAPASGPLDVILAARNWIRSWEMHDPLPLILTALATQQGRHDPNTPTEAAHLLVNAPFQQQFTPHQISLVLPGAAAFLEPNQPIILGRIGRDPRNDMVARNIPFVSRNHARMLAQISPAPAAFLLVDEQSRHGTFVNGQRIPGSHVLCDGDQIGFGLPQAMMIFSQLEATGDVSSRFINQGVPDTQCPQ